MPTYQYACSACGNEFDIVQKFSDDALTECPTCAGELRKVFSAVGIVFKGSGFYRTDSRSSSSSTVSSNTSSTSGSSGSSGESKSGESKPSETKPAAAASAPAS
ncbi:FmdB family zinc ribbon protein [Streptosporangium saharense]|uniref:Putative FmdB family regulatory protein n=1 Tax=Streptosporangium saharense TaxID=1706840 RepID=A0A7W7QQE5_9ACTN|nr:FmdB family zinc ribbon protein [Streptosporangium saharense]MBB4917753.1 putative FmdB family regulatory protein [Streptosporangium saharense]